MLPYIDLGFIKIPLYGVMIATAYFTSYFYLLKRAKNWGYDEKFISDFMFYLVIWGLIGAKILYIITFFNQFGENFYERIKNIFSFDTIRAGFVFYGGLISGGFFFYMYTKKKKLNFLRLADFFSPALALSHSIGRIGCFFAGCCHGKQTNSITGVRFTNPYCEVDPLLLGHKIHPTQIYESFGNFIIFVILHKISKNNKKEGLIISIYTLFYSILRFTVEFFRGDNRGSIIFLSQAQFISILTFLFSIFFIMKLWKKET